MRIGTKDQRVIKAFIEGRAMMGHKLETDGDTLNGLWTGGRNICTFSPGGSQIICHDLGSRSAQTVQRAVARAVGVKQEHLGGVGIIRVPKHMR